MTKIALVLARPPAYSETFLRTKIKGLRKNGFQVTLYCNQHLESDDFDLCPVVIRPKVSKNALVQSTYFLRHFVGLLPYRKRVKRFINLEKKDGIKGIALLKSVYLNTHFLKADVAWIHFGFTTLAVGSEAAARAIEAKMGVSFRGFDMGIYPIKNPGCYDRLWHYVDKVHANSYDLWSEAIKIGMPKSIPMMRITPAINPDKFTASLPDFSPDVLPVFMTTGRLHWKKGYVQILEALALLKQQGIRFQYQIIGDGDDFERIAFAAHQLGLSEEVLLLGRLPHSEVQSRLKLASIYIQYSVQEGFCNAVLEAQSMGRLCVVSDAEGLPENVKHGHSGWVVPRYAPDKLANQLKEILELPVEEKQRIAKNAIERVRQKFTIAQQEQKFIQFFDGEAGN